MLLPGKGKVGISLFVLGSGNSGKEPASILFERSPEDSLDCVCGQISVNRIKNKFPFFFQTEPWFIFHQSLE